MAVAAEKSHTLTQRDCHKPLKKHRPWTCGKRNNGARISRSEGEEEEKDSDADMITESEDEDVSDWDSD